MLAARFEEAARFHPVDVVSPGFVLASSEPNDNVTTITRYVADLPAPFLGVEVEVSRASSVSSTISVGLVGESDTWLRAEVDEAAARVSLVVQVRGVETVLGMADGVLADAAWTLGLAVCENRVTVLARSAGGSWEAVLSASVGPDVGLDLRDPRTLGDLAFAWGVAAGSASLGRVRAGLFGMVGLRDPHLVQHADGTPVVEDDHVFLTWTCAGLGFFPQAHWGVFRLSLSNPSSLEQVAHLFVERDGLRLGDHAGHLVRDGDQWIAAMSTWGDFDGAGVGVRATRSTTDLLRGVHVLRTRPVALPTSDSAWDPALARVDGRWRVAFVESPSQDPFSFHPALASTASDDPFTGLRLDAARASLLQTEGTLIARDREGWKVLASDGDDRRFPVYDLSLDELGTLDAPFGTNIPHAQVIPLPDGGWLLVSFDGTSHFENTVGYGAHGDVVVLRSA